MPQASPAVRVAIACVNCSMGMGGEAAIPFNYFRLLRAQGVDAHLVAHARNAAELTRAFGHEPERLHLAADNWPHRVLWRIGRKLPAEVARCTTGLASRLLTQWQQRPILRRLVREGKVNVIHQPMPVSPAEPSIVNGCGAPVLIGPMNGDIDYPPAFRIWGTLPDRAFVSAWRWLARTLSWVLPGKRKAWMLLAANERTEAALNLYHSHRVPGRISENGVDLSTWMPPSMPRPSATGGPIRFVFAGRLVSWKGVDLLLSAWATLSRDLPVELLIIGDGPARQRLERRLNLLNPARSVRFAGWMPHADVARELAQADVLVHPALRECGGSSVLEAMACALPVIACAWGGPADYVDETCGILIPPITPEQFVRDLAGAILKLAQSRDLREQLGRAAREHVVAHYDWADKVRRIHALYASALDAPVVSTTSSAPPVAQPQLHASSPKKPREAVAPLPAMAGK
jgi:glycosyltransferase involved in cell wall biosynthesis